MDDDKKRQYARKQQQRYSEHLFKVLVVGDASTGKTSFIRRYVHKFYSSAYITTIGVDFALKTIQYDSKTIIRLQLWDVAGQERYGTMTRVYYKDAVGAFLVFDLARSKTFDSIMKWKSDLDSKVSLSDGSNIPCLLLANKCDLVQCSPQEQDVMREFARLNGFIDCVYTSPKDNVNIERAGELLVDEILRRQDSLGGKLLESDLCDDKSIVVSKNEQQVNRNSGDISSNTRVRWCC